MYAAPGQTVVMPFTLRAVGPGGLTYALTAGSGLAGATANPLVGSLTAPTGFSDVDVRVTVPADAAPANNVSHFVFDEPPALHSVIVSDEEAASEPLKAALSAAVDPSRKYIATVLGASHAAEIPWDDTALIVEVLNGYRLKETIPTNIAEFTLPVGVPEILREGTHITLVTYGASCRVAMDAAAELEV